MRSGRKGREMKEVKVTNQAELDQALKSGDYPILIGGSEFDVSGSATVRAYGSATVRAYGSATVTACDFATVTAYDSATVRAYGSATVTASKFVAVTKHSIYTKIDGGVIIDVTGACNTPTNWCDFYGIKVKDGIAIVFKGVDGNYRSPRGFDYSPGSTPIAPDWDGGKIECGQGLHFSPRPEMVREFIIAPDHIMACPVRLSDMAVYGQGQYPQKCKALGCCAPIWEVDIEGNKIETKEVTR